MKRNTLQALLIVFWGVIGTISQASCTGTAKTYYVSQNGNDENPGTEKEPFKSLQKLNTLLLKPGDKICLKGGEIFYGTLSLTVKGEMKRPVIITSYGHNNAIVNGGNKEAIIIRGNYFQLRNIDTKGAGRKNGNTATGIQLLEASHGTVENIKTEGFQKSGIEINSCQNIDVIKVVSVDNGFCGIHITGSKEKRSKNILVKDCKADNNPGDPTNLDNHSGMAYL